MDFLPLMYARQRGRQKGEYVYCIYRERELQQRGYNLCTCPERRAIALKRVQRFRNRGYGWRTNHSGTTQAAFVLQARAEKDA